MRDGVLTTIESVVISYQDITFVCFQTGGIYLNSKLGLPQVRIVGNSSMKRKGDNGQDLNADGTGGLKRLRAHESGAHNSAPPGLNLAPWNNNIQNSPHSVSPTVASASAILGSFSSQSPQPHEQQNGQHAQQQRFPAMPSPLHQPSQLNQSWTSMNNDEANQQSLQSPYYANANYPSVYSSMFQNDARQSGGFMAGSTAIPPMPSPHGNNGLQNLALASSSSYYSDYNPGQQYAGAGQAIGDQKINNLQFIPRQRGESSVSETAAIQQQQPAEPQVIHRVRKNDRNRICTSCGTTNSPGTALIFP